MEDMLARLKSEIKEVKTIDKELTRQFIQLGGMINELKSSQEEDDYDDEYMDGRLNSSITEEENQGIEANRETLEEKKDSCDNTKL